MIDYDMLEDEYGSLPGREKVKQGSSSEALFTDFPRKGKIKPKYRDGVNRKAYEYYAQMSDD